MSQKWKEVKNSGKPLTELDKFIRKLSKHYINEEIQEHAKYRYGFFAGIQISSQGRISAS